MPTPLQLLRRLRLILVVIGSAAALLADTRAQTAQTVISLETLHTFRGNGDGSQPHGGLTAGGDGFYYGTTVGGGTSGHIGGTLFRLAPDGTLVTLSSFLIGAPYAPPAIGLDGNLYGTGTLGGQGNNGFVFRSSADGTTRVVGAFDSNTTGSTPYAGLLLGSDGNFYGTTTSGVNALRNGAIFRITPTGTVRILHVFSTDDSDGILPYGALVQGRDGDFYGTTSTGGPHGMGTVFRVSGQGFFNTVYAFTGGADGADPQAGLLPGSDGNFYGTTLNGATLGGGTVFQVTPTGKLTTLHAFDASQREGINPAGPLLDGGDGFFYGTTVTGGTSDKGTIFAVNAATSFLTLYNFTGGKDGALPYGKLALGGSGIFYGTTSAGGLNNQNNGTAFRLNLHALPDVPGTLSFSAPGTTVNENAGTVVLTVNRTGGSTGAVGAGYTTADGTARAGVDFLAVSGQVAWAAGDTVPKQITVPLTDSGLSDGSTRTFSVRLLATTGGATLGTGSETVNILENDPVQPTTVTLSVIGDGTAIVGGENGKVLFTRSGDSKAALRVGYELKGAPINGVDYQFLPGSLTIPAGAVSAKLKIKPQRGAELRGVGNVRILPVAPSDGSFVVEPAKVKIRFVHE